ncbi:unnamed protein product [Sphenostylis stenocarpa]|uniref:Uncharacterized protein n=1 Tax=Sphenostylis stenocarpa TaxID=92480 RepID=A0AA86S725_9FABA|nr:unnamed protein product [Sphenostylis stenocarpa]
MGPNLLKKMLKMVYLHGVGEIESEGDVEVKMLRKSWKYCNQKWNVGMIQKSRHREFVKKDWLRYRNLTTYRNDLELVELGNTIPFPTYQEWFMQKIDLFWLVTFTLRYTKVYMYGTNNKLLVHSRQLGICGNSEREFEADFVVTLTRMNVKTGKKEKRLRE